MLVAALAAIPPARGGAPRVIDLAIDPDPIRIEAEEPNDLFGSAGAACDVNGDGIEDLVLGAAYASGIDNARRWGGEVYVIFGRRGRWHSGRKMARDADVRIVAAAESDNLGNGLACGDVNGDGVGDLILCAPDALGEDIGRLGSGQVHILFGRASWPPVIDLAVDPGVLIRGETRGGALCYEPRVGDLDGDGLADLLLDDSNGVNPAGTSFEYGRAYVLFGRAAWPSEIDLLTDGADVRFYGCGDAQQRGDGLASGTTVGDLDADGTADLVLAADQGDGPGDNRQAAGDLYVFRGRAAWLPEYDLCSSSPSAPDIYIVGRDPWDGSGVGRSLFDGDLDGDGFGEVQIGVTYGDGEANALPDAGEARIFEPGIAWPSFVDLKTTVLPVVFGGNAGDRCAAGVRTGDIDGDGRDELALSCVYYDLADRTDAGQVAVVMGRPTHFGAIRLGNGDADVVILGSRPNDCLGVLAALDLNADGYDDLLVSAYDYYHLGAAWVVNWMDVDGDGITQLRDTCPLVADPAQLDGDGDGIGDACDGDYDGDGQTDDQDCAPNRAAGGNPAEVHGLELHGASSTALTWTPAPFGDRYDVSRGALAEIGRESYGACKTAADPNPTDTSFVDPDLPLPASGFFYLVRAVNTYCRLAGTWGTDSTGAPRVNGDPAGCP